MVRQMNIKMEILTIEIGQCAEPVHYGPKQFLAEIDNENVKWVKVVEEYVDKIMLKKAPYF